MKKTMIILNPSSGHEEAENLVKDLVAVIDPLYDSVNIMTTEKEGDAQAFARQASRDTYDALYLMGGDGTINEGICGIADQDHRPIVGMVPLGTVNNASSMLGFSRQAQEAIPQFRHAEVGPMDIGKVNGQYFSSSVVTGILAESVSDVSVEDKSQLGPFAYVKESLSALREEGASPFALTLDGEKITRDYSLIIVAVGHALVRYQHLFPDARIDDGQLSFMGLRRTDLAEKFEVAGQVLNQGVVDSDLMDTSRLQQCTIKLLDDTAYSRCIIDGDEGPELPLHIRILPRHIQVFKARQA